MIIIFFIGLVLMVSGEAISAVCNITYMNLICNIIGGAMMCISMYSIIQAEIKKKNELKLMIENLIGKEDQVKEIELLASVVNAIQKSNKNLEEIGLIQNTLASNIVDQSVFNEKMDLINKSIENNILKLENDINSKCEHLENIIQNCQSTFKDESILLRKAVEVLHADNIISSIVRL